MSDSRPHDPLTPGETDVLNLIAMGYEDKAISAKLGLSPSGVRHRFISLARKMGAVNRPHAVRRGFETGVLRLAEEASQKAA